MVRIAIADDHEMVRAALSLLLARLPEVEIAFEAPSLERLLTMLETKPCDVLLLDLNLPDSSGIATIEKVRASAPDIPILVLSAYPEEEFAMRAFEAGATGYLHKSATADELSEAVVKLARGQRYVNRRLEEVLPLGRTLESASVSALDRLSKREFEVLRMVAAGMSNKEIAEKLDVSPKTVSTYRTRMMEKLGLETRSQLYRFAIEHELHLPL